MAKSHDRIIASLIKWRKAGVSEPLRNHVSLLAKYGKARERFNKTLSALEKKGHIDFPDGETVTLTDKGMRENGFLDPASMSPVRDEEVQDLIRDMLKPDMAKIFDELSDGLPRSLNSLAAALDYERRPDELKKVLRAMKSIHLVFIPRDPSGWKMKMVQLTDLCFPLGRHYA